MICIYENRPSCEPGIRLLLASLCTHVPDMPVMLFHNPDSREFGSWVKQFRQVTFRPADKDASLSWNIKPEILIEFLEKGFDEVFWLDSDIIVMSNFMRVLSAIDRSKLVLAEEARGAGYDDRMEPRVTAWNLDPGRSLPHAMNSCVIRAHRCHLPLLRAWREMISSDEYRMIQKQPWYDRPRHMIGDQDALTALLASAPYSDVEIYVVHRGSQIVQLFGPLGYGIMDRIRSANDNLLFVHAQGTKPWLRKTPSGTGSFRDKLMNVLDDVSPYTLHAAAYKAHLRDEAWLEPKTQAGRILSIMGLGRPFLTGAPVSLLIDAIYALTSLKSILRKPLSAR